MNTASDHDEGGTAPEPPQETASTKPGLWARFKDYLWDWRAVLAVCVAMLLIGGLAGLSLGMAVRGRQDFREGQMRHGHGFRGPQGGFGHWQGGFGGQMPGPGSGPGRPGEQAPKVPAPSGSPTPQG